MNRFVSRGFSLIEALVGLIVFSAIVAIAIGIVLDMEEDKAIRLGVSNLSIIIDNTTKVINKNYPSIIQLSSGQTDTSSNIKLGELSLLKDVLQSSNKNQLYMGQISYLYVDKCSNLSPQSQMAENCKFRDDNSNNGDLVSYLVLPMSNSSIFKKVKNSVALSQMMGDFAFVVKYTRGTPELVNSRLNSIPGYSPMIMSVLSKLQPRANDVYIVVDLNPYSGYRQTMKYSNNDKASESDVTLNRSTGTSTSQNTDGYISLSYNFNIASGVNNYLKFGNSAFLKAGRTLDANQHPIMLSNQSIRAPLSLTNENMPDNNFIINVNGTLYVNGKQSNIQQ